MKIVFVMIVFQSDFVLGPCLEAVRPIGRVVAAEGPVQYWQDRGFTTSTDRTNEILDAFGVQTIHGQWAEKDEEAQAAFSLVPDDADFVWMLDSDEVWRAEDIRRIIALLESGDIDSMAFKPWSFYGGFSRWMTGFEREFEWLRIQRWCPGAKFASHRPLTVLAPDGQPWRQHRHLNQYRTAEMGLCFWHYSYVFPEQIKAKTEYYHSWSPTIKDYFNRVYLPWVLGDDMAKARVEDEFDGVHDWLPSRRGACRTATFAGQHPRFIQERMSELQARFDRELAQWKH